MCVSLIDDLDICFILFLHNTPATLHTKVHKKRKRNGSHGDKLKYERTNEHIIRHTVILNRLEHTHTDTHVDCWMLLVE